MMNITQPAADLLHGLLRRVRAPQGVVIRLVPQSASLSLQTDIARPDDWVFDRGGKPVLVVDRQVEAAFSDMTLDIRTTDDRVSLVLASGP
ncbi:MAG: hypothetical protein JW940_35785 [Polyangiaceae bacterium]|nr:hypothetical protein [Polyangiaceae bacterium]